MDTISGSTFTIKKWVRFTFWGWLLGVALIIMISSFLGSIGIEGKQFYLGLGISSGVSLFQGLLLKKYLPIHQKWLVYSIIAMSVPFIIIDYLPSGFLVYKLAWSVAFGALFLSILQYVILKEHCTRVVPWIGISFIGWILGVITVFSVDYTMKLKIPTLLIAVVNLSLILSGGAVLGLVTGSTMKKALVP